jgi:methyltransferase (TIGR00027 family)
MSPITEPAAGFGAGQPSRTSILVAAARAFGAREPDPSVRNPDYLAERLLGPAERQLISEHPIIAALEEDYEQARQTMEVAGVSNMMLARTRFIDEHLERAVANGATQVVIMGAGFDTRAWRFQALLKDTKVFEVDYHSTQEFKKRRVSEVLSGAPPNLVFVEVDFKRDTLADVLRGAGFQPGQKTFFIWEGVIMYLSENAVRETLRTVATLSPPGSSLVMDFTGRFFIDMLAKMPELPQHRFTTGWGEPWIFGVPDGREREFFRECGLELRETLRLFGRKVGKRYWTRADGTRLSPRRRPPSDQSSPIKRIAEAVKMLWMVAKMISKRSMGYALAELVVPDAPNAARRRS